MSVRNVLHWPAEASHFVVRTDCYDVKHVDLNTLKHV
jgi:hypothetical protein